jgi:ribosomal protein S11
MIKILKKNSLLKKFKARKSFIGLIKRKKLITYFKKFYNFNSFYDYKLKRKLRWCYISFNSCDYVSSKKIILKKKISYAITIKIKPNNIFCTLSNTLKSNKTEIIYSAGLLGIKTSKRKLKFSSRVVIDKFLKRLNTRTRRKSVLINISGPKRIRNKILLYFIKSLRKARTAKIIANIIPKKIFNGCRSKKQKRKKRKGFRIFN